MDASSPMMRGDAMHVGVTVNSDARDATSSW